MPKTGVRFLVQMLFQQGSNYTPEGGVEIKEAWVVSKGAKQEAMVENILVRMWVCEKITGSLCKAEEQKMSFLSGQTQWAEQEKGCFDYVH